MKNRVQKIGMVACVLLMTCGCVIIPTSEKTLEAYVRFCQGLVGHDMEVVFEAWGYADRTFVLPGGTKAYAYMRSEDPVAYRSGMYYEIHPPDLMIYPPRLDDPVQDGPVLWSYRSSRWCSTYFETDAQNRIIKVTWHGECRRAENRNSH
jgi:hypothetical protein